ncbi:MAG: bifunctional 4-hydroxy-2-oxoglutarate aldolase/2-dehydro-3-deoxy-phosphogluconate aldolase [Pirellulales bacterium]|nr:bifunctional 4-hydroxy-2-oxoglutarate aldolase/2-dehydro-3-deoxy-phosphogluconate aldolase [Pirellulales bacterium]
MTPPNSLERLLDSRLVAILRSGDSAVLVDAAEALAAGGIDAIEVTFTVPRPLHVLEAVADRLGDRTLIGAGTVLDTATARAAMLAGARFIVAPALNLDVIRLCRQHAVPVAPGAFTPTEILTAWEAGADLVKVFPCEVVGPAYLRAIRAPLPQIRLMPTGGVTLDTATEFLKAGAAVLGVGSALASTDLMTRRDWEALTGLARRFAAIVRQH